VDNALSADIHQYRRYIRYVSEADIALLYHKMKEAASLGGFVSIQFDKDYRNAISQLSFQLDAI